MSAPDDETLLSAVKAIRMKEPTLARAKILKQLKEENNWELSEKRLKTCMDTHGLNSTQILPTGQKIKPRDATFDDVVKEAFQELTILERDFMLNLPQADCEALMHYPEHIGKRLNLFLACQNRHHVEILLTLKGLKPCTGIHHHYATGIFTRLVNDIIKPWMQKYNLKTYGFELRQITQPTNIGTHIFWRGGWIFADTRSNLWPEVQSVLLPTSAMNVTIRGRNDYEDKVSKALGYPTRWPRMERHNIVSYIDETETGVLTALWTHEDDCNVEVIGTEYWDDEGNLETWQKCMDHLVKCTQALESVGSKLRVDLDGHPALRAFYNKVQSGQA